MLLLIDLDGHADKRRAHVIVEGAHYCNLEFVDSSHVTNQNK